MADLTMKETMVKLATDKVMTYGETLGPAMGITDQGEASAYYNLLIGRSMRGGTTREEAESIVKSNLGYFAGYCSNEVRSRVNLLFGAVHPVFGNNQPTAGEAFKKGLEMGKSAS